MVYDIVPDGDEDEVHLVCSLILTHASTVRMPQTDSQIGHSRDKTDARCRDNLSETALNSDAGMQSSGLFPKAET